MRNNGAFKNNIWMHLYADRYEELFTYSMTLCDNNKQVAEEMVRTLSIQYFADPKKLNEEISKLPSDYADVLRLHFLKLLSPDQITKELPLTIYQVKSRIQKGVVKIRRKINPDYYVKLTERAYQLRPDLR